MINNKILTEQYYDILQQISLLAQNYPEIKGLWVGGSLATKIANRWSNINLFIEYDMAMTEDMKSFLTALPCQMISAIDNLQPGYTLYGVTENSIWLEILICQDMIKSKIKYIDLLNPESVHKFLEEDHFDCQFKVIPPCENQTAFLKALEDCLSDFLITLGRLVNGISKKDFLITLRSIDQLRSLLIEGYVKLAKHNHLIDSQRIEGYVPQHVQKLLFKTYQITNNIDYDNFELSCEQIKENLSSMTQLFGELLFEYDNIDKPFPIEKLQSIEKLFLDKLKWVVNFSPKASYEQGKYSSENIAQHYDEVRFMADGFKQGLKKMANQWFRGKKVLELGAGTGRIGLEVIPFVEQYNGIEQSRTMLDQFYLKLGKQFDKNIMLKLGDIMRLNQEFTHKFDVIFEHEVLLMTLDPTIVSEQIMNLLNDGGLFLRIVVSRQKDSLYNYLYNVFNHAVCEYTGLPFIIKGTATDARVTYFLAKKKYKTTKENLSNWKEKVYLGDVINSMKCLSVPYLENVKKEVLEYAINAVYAEAKKFNLNSDEDFFNDKRELFCYVNRKKS